MAPMQIDSENRNDVRRTLLNAVRSNQMYSSCPVCSGTNLKPRWEVNGYTIASCDACSLTFVQNQVTTKELDAHYASTTDDAYDDANVECLNYYRSEEHTSELQSPM